MKFCTVTISRQYASGGTDVAGKLSNRLGWVLFDRQVLQRAAESAGLTERDMRPFDEPYFDSLSVALYRFTSVARKRPSLKIDPKGRVRAGSTRFDDKDYSKIVVDFVRDLYRQKKAVIAGRGSQCILADHPDVLHVRIEAPREYRIQLCQERLEVTKARAGKIVRDMDLRQENFLKHFFRVKGDESRLYHVILNSGKISIDTMVDILEGLLRE